MATISQRELGELLTYGWQIREITEEGDDLIFSMWDSDGQEQDVPVKQAEKYEPPTPDDDAPEGEKVKQAAEQAREAGKSVKEPDGS